MFINLVSGIAYLGIMNFLRFLLYGNNFFGNPNFVLKTHASEVITCHMVIFLLKKHCPLEDDF